MYILQAVELKEEIQAVKTEQWLQVFPRGKVYIEHYDDTLNCNDAFFNQMIEAFNSKSLHKPFIDVNHEFKESYGSIDKLEIRKKGLFASVTLNENGFNAIKNNEYKYISPAFGNVTDNKGNKYENALIAVTLTNIPALQGTLPTLQEQLKLSGQLDDIKILSFEKPHKNGGKTMKLLANHLGLNSEASEDKILEAIKANEKKLEVERDHAVKKLEAKSKELDIAVKELEAKSKELETIELEKNEAEKKEYFDKAAKEGRIEPKEMKLFEEHWDENKEFVMKILDARPIIKTEQKTLTSQVDGKKLEAVDREIMKENELDPDKPEDVKKYFEWTKE
jgi:phage I-like protein